AGCSRSSEFSAHDRAKSMLTIREIRIPDHLLDLMGEKLAGFGSVAEVARALEELPSDLDGMFNKMRKWGVGHSEPNACSFPGFLGHLGGRNAWSR
ncbi:hypothetical protein, partial [Bradyrhizobium liaoningense]|uniref:hypothetical protein n=1 Tax=Bradyrhizobium liaoningense TaxID=43992 RepID=UPI001BAC598E